MVESERLRTRIKERGTTQREISEEIGITQNALSQKVNNLRRFSIEEAADLMEILEIPFTELREYFPVERKA